MSTDYIRKKNRLKRQWSYIDAALKIVQSNERNEKRKTLFESIMKSDFITFKTLVDDDPMLTDCSMPIGYNYFNIYQVIIDRCTDKFIENLFTKYYHRIKNSTENGRILIPVACERGDETILKLILKYFSYASLDSVCNRKQAHYHNNSILEHELGAFENETGLTWVIRNDRSDLLLILFQFKSFILDYAKNHWQRKQMFNLCLLAEHHQIYLDQYHIKWFKNQSLRPCGSLECLRLLIENVQLNPYDIYNDENLSIKSPFIIVLSPIYHYLINLHKKLLENYHIQFHKRLLRALYDLIHKQINLFGYLITHCCFQPNENDFEQLNECNQYMNEIFHKADEYLLIKQMMFKLNKILFRINMIDNKRCLSLKEICRLKFRNYLRMNQNGLVQIERTLINLSSTHKDYLKCLN